MPRLNAIERGINQRENDKKNDQPDPGRGQADRGQPRLVAERVEQHPWRDGHHDQDRQDEGEHKPDHVAGRGGRLVDAPRVAGEDGDVEPEVIQALVAAEPDRGARQRDHQAVEDRHADSDEQQVHCYAADGHLHLGPRWQVRQGVDQQSDREQDLVEHRQVHLLERDQELRVDRFQQCEVQVPGADQLAEVGAVGHEQRLDQSVDQHPGRHEGKVLVLVPAGCDVGDVAEDDLEESDLIEPSTTVRRLSLFDTVDDETSQDKIDNNSNEISKLEPTLEDKKESEEVKEESYSEEYDSDEEMEELSGEDFNQESEDELLDIPTFLRRQAN